MQQFEKLTSELISKARRNIGREVPQGNQICDVVTANHIRRSAWGLGDDNPLWSDEEYARQTRWGNVIAPPCFIEMAFTSSPVWPRPRNRPETEKTARGGGMAGVGVLYTGTQNTYLAPIKASIHVKAVQKLVGIVDSQGRVEGDLIVPDADLDNAFAATAASMAVPGRMVDHIRELRMYDSDTGRLLIRQLHHGVRFERVNGPEAGKYRDYKPPYYSEEALNQIYDAYEREARRGAEPLPWEGVQVGQELGPIIRGPLTISGMTAFQTGHGGVFSLAERDWFRFVSRHPGAGIRHPVTNVPTDPETIHFEPHGAATYGFPAPYFLGQQGLYWPAILVTNWMGDDGHLLKLNMWNYRPLFLYEMVTIRGKVTGKEKTEEGALVHLDIWSVTQADEPQAKGNATIALPSRSEWSRYF